MIFHRPGTADKARTTAKENGFRSIFKVEKWLKTAIGGPERNPFAGPWSALIAPMSIASERQSGGFQTLTSCNVGQSVFWEQIIQAAKQLRQVNQPRLPSIKLTVFSEAAWAGKPSCHD